MTAVTIDARLTRRLRLAAYVFAFGSAIHLIDHLRRGQGSVSDSLYWLGNLGLILQVTVITLAITGHRRAPHTAVVAGLLLASGFAVVHWLPHWSALSDPVWAIPSARWFSYIASLSEIVGALAVAIVAATILRERSAT